MNAQTKTTLSTVGRTAAAALIAAFMIRFGSTSPQGSCSGSCREVIGTVFLAVDLIGVRS